MSICVNADWLGAAALADHVVVTRLTSGRGSGELPPKPDELEEQIRRTIGARGLQFGK
jgi:hypothetical protein